MVGATKLRTGAALLLGVSVLALSACEQKEQPSPEARPTGPGAVTGTPTASGPGGGVEAIKEAPARYYGKTVTVSGDVDQIYNDRAFELEGTGWAFNDNITVLTKTPVRLAGAPLSQDEDLIVTGTVRQYVAADLNRDLGWTITPDLQSKIEKRPVLVADSIRSVTEYGSWSASGAAATEKEPIRAVLLIVTNPDAAALVGRKVDLGRERVQAVTGKGLWVGPSAMSEVFVLPKQPLKDKEIKAGDWVHVTDGTVEKAPKDAVKEWNLPSNMEGLPWENMLYVKDATVAKGPEQPAGGKGTTGPGTPGQATPGPGTTGPQKR